MDKIQMTKLNKIDIENLQIHQWAVWSCDVSEFDWEYTDRESCFIYEGIAQVATLTETVQIAEGDFVVFPKGLQCRWKVISPIRKYYKFG